MEQTEPLSFELKLTAKDLWGFSMYQMTRGIMAVVNLAFPLAALILLFGAWNSTSGEYKLLLMVLILMFTVWQPFMLYKKAEKQAQKDAIKIPARLTLGAEGIKVMQNQDTVDVPWEKIVRAEQGYGNILLYTDKVHAYVLPDSSTGEQKDAVLKLLQEQIPGKRRKRI